MTRKFLLFLSFFILISSAALAETEPFGDTNIFAIVRDSKDSVWVGYLSDFPSEVMVSSASAPEKTIPSKYIKSITLEKISGPCPNGLDPKQESKYSVRLENSQEVYTLRKKYTFSLKTDMGVVTRSIDPNLINGFVSDDLDVNQKQKPLEDKPFIQDKSIIFSLEFRF